MSGAELEARASLAEGYQRAWGCPNAGHTPPAKLRPDLEDEARYYAETLGLIPLSRKGKEPAPLPRSACTCPFAALSRMPRAMRELLRFSRLSQKFKGAMTFEQVVGRVPSLWDVAALDALVLAEAEAHRADEAQREADRKAQAEKPR